MRPYCVLFFGIGENFHTQNDIQMTTTIFYIFVSQGISLCQESYTKIRPNSFHSLSSLILNLNFQVAADKVVRLVNALDRVAIIVRFDTRAYPVCDK